ncbi:MAG: hypothetical protein ACYDA6_09340, partial [Solirubrobacteraceae bacterium]
MALAPTWEGARVARRSMLVEAGVLIAATITLCGYAVVANRSPKLAVVLLLGMVFVPIALWRLPVAICAWTVMVFLSSTTSIGEYTNRAMLFIALCWIGLLLGRRIRRPGAIVANQLLVAMIVAFLAWLLVTLIWAPAPSAVAVPLKLVLYGGLEFLLVLGGLPERRHLRWLAYAFVAGAALSVLWGAAQGGLSAATSVTSEVVGAAGRFQGGAGDPNYLAATLVPAIVLAGGLAVGASRGKQAALALAA